jgi:hypothetical protein
MWGPYVPFACAVLVVLLAAPGAAAATYGDIEITLTSEPRGTSSHGYAEFQFLVVNHSTQAPHDVLITYPKSGYGYGQDYLRAVSRSVTVEPNKSVRVSLAFPERLHPDNGGGAGIAIDGREQEDPLSVGGGLSSRGYGGGYGGRSYGSGVPILVLYSQKVDTRFPDWVRLVLGGPTRTAGSYNTEAVRADYDSKEWSTNWLGYTRYDGVVVTTEDLRGVPAEVRTALGQYVECGGSLFVLGPDPPSLGAWKFERLTLVPPAAWLGELPPPPVSVAAAGFGQCFITDARDLSPFPNTVFRPVIESWNETAKPWQNVREPGEANRAFPVVDDVGVPVKGLLALMLVFAIVIGPLNMIWLARKKRKLWLFWTVPLISFVTCFAVISFMAVTEGWSGRSRIEGFTVLDENSRRASTLGWTGFYTPLLPRGGLHFSPETEVSYQNGDDDYSSYGYRSRSRRSAGSALTIDWTRDQHLSSGWLTPRVPAHFVLRRSELRRERMTITKAADGSVEAVNGLGADLSAFWYRDEAGNLFHAKGISAGERATLNPTQWTAANAAGAKTLRNIYTGDWSAIAQRAESDGPGLLQPRTYLAVMESAPFVDDGMPGASVRRTRSVVYGILKEGGDGS